MDGERKVSDNDLLFGGWRRFWLIAKYREAQGIFMMRVDEMVAAGDLLYWDAKARCARAHQHLGGLAGLLDG